MTRLRHLAIGSPTRTTVWLVFISAIATSWALTRPSMVPIMLIWCTIGIVAGVSLSGSA
jgi:hypothetical protein